ncbi:hypothetical protein SAMN05444392_101551 [Seinonella peptonophila]|uniref:Uncharacterized protein n=1 Tax=Seinonella peptonophila TaxID=112248 RepID=A0A1M4TNK9_9BACL|nr:CD1247 N-terminal domain-containing protein [Seinonella peptonophila]SHE45877.1 hypothetical protein SAMN05444392_101551 [Seinonella peptonophila]
MQHLQREVAYLQGMLAGCKNKESHEYLILKRLLDLQEELVKEQEHLQLRQTELEEYTEAIDEDLNELELEIYDDQYSITCPNCGEEVLVDEDDLEDDDLALLCPNCHHELFPEEDKKDSES